jgi:hypothetical protein
MPRACHAIQIDTNSGNGELVAYTNTSIGVDAGVFYLITDRPTISAVAGDTTRTAWYQGVLTKDLGDFAPSRRADFVVSGGLEEVSALSFSIVNTTSFWDTLRDNGVYLHRCRVTYFYVESVDGATWTFTRRWTGIVEDQPFNETTYQVKCVDASKDIFKSLPVDVVDASAYPTAKNSGDNNQVPIVIGRVAYSPLVNVNAGGQITNLTHIDGAYGTVCAAKDHNVASKWVDLYTQGRTFPLDSVDLVGRFLEVVAGGTSQTLRIKSNLATVAGDETTRVTVDEPWTGTIINWDIGDDVTTVWYFQVKAYTAEFLSSSKPVFEQVENGSGQLALYSHDAAEKRFQSLSELKTISDPTAIRNYGRPGTEVIMRRLETDGNIGVYTPILPRDITLAEETFFFDWTGPDVVGDSQPSLFDGSQGTSYVMSQNANLAELTIDLGLPTSETDKSYDEIYVLLNARIRRSSPGLLQGNVLITAQGVDLHGRVTEDIFTQTNIYESSSEGNITDTWIDIHTLPGVYFNESDNPDKFFSKKSLLSLTSILSGSIKSKVYSRVRLEVLVALSLGGPWEMEIYEVGLVGKKTVNLVNDTIYHTLKGETFGTEWASPEAPGTGRFNADAMIPDIGHAFEHLVRNYDYNHPVWQASAAYVVGSKVRSEADNGFIYVCTVAGTSAANQPAFPVTLGSTVTDGGVTWKCQDKLRIHCAAFDTLNTQKAGWFVGMYLQEKERSEEVYKRMAEQGVFGILMDAQGRVKPKAWRENDTSLATFSASNIQPGSLGDAVHTPMSRAHNDFLLKYDKNYATGNFDRQVGITHVNEPAFPGVNDTIVPGTSLGTFEIGLIADGLGNYIFDIITDTPHGLETGAWVSLSENTHGYTFGPRQASVKDAVQFFVEGFLTAGTLSTTGTLRVHTDTRLKWKTFAPGISNHPLAQQLWEQCRENFLITKQVNPLVLECPYFISPDATDPAGNRIWSDLAGGDDHPAIFLLTHLVEWASLQKRQLTFEVPNTSTFRALEVFDPVQVNDAKLTMGDNLLGWIHEITDAPGTGTRGDRIRFGVTLNPDELDVTDIIDENGADPGDIIDENGAAGTDIIDEN